MSPCMGPMKRELGGRVYSNIVDESWFCNGPLSPPPRPHPHTYSSSFLLPPPLPPLPTPPSPSPPAPPIPPPSSAAWGYDVLKRPSRTLPRLSLIHI
eukprot:710719-Pyramimonas_sp.AAC.1